MAAAEQTSELHKTLEEVRKIANDIKEKTDDNKGIAEDLAKQEKAFAAICKIEDVLQKNVVDLAERDKRQKDLETKLEEMERKFYRCSENQGSVDFEIADLKKDLKDNFEKFLRGGKSAIDSSSKFHSLSRSSFKDFFTAKELKYLRTDSNPEGGYLIIPEYSNEIIKKVTEFSPIRQYARVIPINTKEYRMPSRTALVSAGWVGEAEETIESNSSYGREALKTHSLGVTVKVTREDLDDSFFDIQSLISEDVTERFVQKQGLAFVKGNGSIQPEGLMTNKKIGSVNTGIADGLSFTSMFKVLGEIKTAYTTGGQFTFNRRTRSYLMTLQDGNGRYLWTAGNIAAGIPSTVAGEEYFLSIDIDDVGANKYPVLYGSFREGYLIVDRLGMSMIRDDATLASQNIVRFIFHMRTGAQVIKAEAFKKIKCSV